MNDRKIRLIPAGTLVWSVQLQASIRFEQDQIVAFVPRADSNTVFGIVGRTCMLLYNIPGYIPTLVENTKNEVIFNISDSIPYTVPKSIYEQPGFFQQVKKETE